MKITREILKDISRKSLENAEELVVDALILEKHGRKERAYTLFQLSIEEVGKAVQSLNMILEKGYQNEAKAKEYEKFFKDHKSKTLKSRGMDIVIAEVLSKGDKEKALEILNQSQKDAEEITKINENKNYSLYTSFYMNKVVTPSEFISLENLTRIKEIAVNRLKAASAFVKIGLQNIEEIEKYISQHPLDKVDYEKLAQEFWEQFD